MPKTKKWLPVVRTLAAALVSCSALVAPLSVQAVVIVAPNNFAAVAGDSSNCIPTTGCGNRDRYEQVFASSQFGALSGPELITQIAFRRNESGVSPFTHSFTNVVIGLSTTSAAPDALSTTFSANQGADFTVVHSGALILSSASSGSGGPQPFDIVIVFATPFLYDPSAGNLLFDWQNFGGETISTTVAYDATNVFGDSVSRLFSNAGAPANAITGNLDSLGLIAQFTTTRAQAPEPGTLGLLALGLMGLALRRR